MIDSAQPRSQKASKIKLPQLFNKKKIELPSYEGFSFALYSYMITNMNIRLATYDDLEEIRNIFLVAKSKMVSDGNLEQWKDIDYPFCYTKEDIDKCFKGLQGMILCSTEVLKAKNEQNLKIVNIMSSAALRGNKQEAVYCATKWGEKGYTESLKAAYKGTSVKVIGVYPGGINTNFYKNSRDYVSEEKQNTFMKASDVAETILSNVINEKNLTVADIIIERNA